jgi:geranylgeranyl pyrophosphate synthase
MGLKYKTLNKTSFFSAVQEQLQQVEDRMHAQSEGHHSELGAALDHLLSSGGKRVRPAVTLLTGGMLGGDPERLVTLAAAIELLHTATLVHDDLIDGSLLRRGIPTLNAQWSPAATVLTGDFIFARAAWLASEANSVEVMKMFADTLSTIVNGEITQLFNGHNPVSRGNYYRRIQAKTASLFELATGAAALVSPANESIFEKVRKYGHEIGMAFQIVDDVLDFTGEQATVGKPIASDLRQGLITLPALFYLENHPNDADIKALLNGNRYDDERIERAIQAIRTSGAIDDSLTEARQHVEEAVDVLMDFPESPERQSLEDLAFYIVERQK